MPAATPYLILLLTLRNSAQSKVESSILCFALLYPLPRIDLPLPTISTRPAFFFFAPASLIEYPKSDGLQFFSSCLLPQSLNPSHNCDVCMHFLLLHSKYLDSSREKSQFYEKQSIYKVKYVFLFTCMKLNNKIYYRIVS